MKCLREIRARRCHHEQSREQGSIPHRRLIARPAVRENSKNRRLIFNHLARISPRNPLALVLPSGRKELFAGQPEVMLGRCPVFFLCLLQNSATPIVATHSSAPAHAPPRAKPNRAGTRSKPVSTPAPTSSAPRLPACPKS